MKRSISLSASAYAFLDNYDHTLRQMGLSRATEWVAEHLIQLLYFTLPCCSFGVQPRYVGVDPDRVSYSIYDFTETFFTGTYSSTADSVHVLELALNEACLWFIFSDDALLAAAGAA